MLYFSRFSSKINKDKDLEESGEFVAKHYG